MRSIAAALNSLGSNIWSVILIFMGVGLIIKGHTTEGSALMTGAFGVFRSESNGGTNRRVDDVDKTVAKS